jgi:hypothetical protein
VLADKYFGQAVAHLGDVDGDGIGDITVGILGVDMVSKASPLKGGAI